jgi:hypothetical protein
VQRDELDAIKSRRRQRSKRKIENHSLDTVVQNCGSLAGTSTIARMAAFRNNTVNLLNLHYGIHSLALSGGGAFFLVFLLKSGVPVPAVLACRHKPDRNPAAQQAPDLILANPVCCHPG